MAQILVTFETAWYQNIASVKNYYEGLFEDRVLKHATDVFSHYHVFKCKFPFAHKKSRADRFKPDLLLISKKFNKWIIVELETCGKDLTHTKKQLTCFFQPEFDTKELTEYLIKTNSTYQHLEREIFDTLENKPLSVMVIYDDYCTKTFKKLRDLYSGLYICVLETYRTTSHPSETYRISGDYPYDISGVTQLEPLDYQHYKLQRPSLFTHLPINQDIVIKYYMKDLRVRLFQDNKDLIMKIPNNPLSPGQNLILKISSDNDLIVAQQI